MDSTPERIGGFRVIRRLATGGTSDVLLARAEGPHGFERVVVLKRLLAQFRDDASFERMFAREAAAYARLSHPAIVKLYDFFAADGQLVMVLEYVDGLPLNKLRALLRAHAGASEAMAGATRPGPVPGELDDRAALFVASRVFSALAAAHSARDVESGEFAPVIHRDVNPSNVLIPWDGHVKLADFGIAKVAGMQSDTKAGYIKGTYGYMAPEQVRGETVTPRTDVYAASLLLWELLARRKAIQRGALPDIEVLRAMAEPQVPSLDVLRPDLPAELRDAIRRGLEPQQDKRAIFADELVGVLRAAANLEEGRALLADAMALVRPPAPSEDLEKTQSRVTRASAQSFSDTEINLDRPSLAETERVPSLSEPDATLENVPLPSFADAPPPAPPRPPPPPRPGVRTQMGIGVMSANGTPRSPAPPLAAPVPMRSPAPPLAAPVTTKTVPLTPRPAPVGSKTLPLAHAVPARPMTPAPAITKPPPPIVPSRPAFAPMAPAHDLAQAMPTPPPPFAMPAAPPPALDEEMVVFQRVQRRNTWLLGAAVGFSVMCVVLVVGLLFLRWRGHASATKPTASATATATATATTPTPAPPAAPEPTPTPPPASTVGDLDTSAARPQHRVFVDGRVVGETPGTFHVACGHHKVKLGSQGTTRDVDVPCGGALKVSDR